MKILPEIAAMAAHTPVPSLGHSSTLNHVYTILQLTRGLNVLNKFFIPQILYRNLSKEITEAEGNM